MVHILHAQAIAKEGHIAECSKASRDPELSRERRYLGGAVKGTEHIVSPPLLSLISSPWGRIGD